MSLKVLPKIRQCELSAVKPGSLIQFRENLAITLFDPKYDDAQYYASYSSENKRFSHCGIKDDPSVLVLGDNLVLEIDARARAEKMQPEDSVGVPLFVFGDSLRIVVRGGRYDESWSFVDMTKGELSKPVHGLRPAFTKWKLGVRDASDKPMWLIEAE